MIQKSELEVEIEPASDLGEDTEDVIPSPTVDSEDPEHPGKDTIPMNPSPAVKTEDPEHPGKNPSPAVKTEDVKEKTEDVRETKKTLLDNDDEDLYVYEDNFDTMNPSPA